MGGVSRWVETLVHQPCCTSQGVAVMAAGTVHPTRLRRLRRPVPAITARSVIPALGDESLQGSCMTARVKCPYLPVMSGCLSVEVRRSAVGEDVRHHSFGGAIVNRALTWA